MIFLVVSQMLIAQTDGNYNPFVNSGSISPAPLLPVQEGGTGVISFSTGNTGNDPLDIFPGESVTISIILSNGEPNDANPLNALSGSAASLFTWSFNKDTYTGEQSGTIPANYSGTISVGYKVIKNSSQDNPQNGIRVDINPASYQNTSNSQTDDNLEEFTWTECTPPSAPVIGTITQPTCDVTRGSVNLTGLPGTGTWTLIMNPGNVSTTGTGTSRTITNISPGTYNFTVTSAADCMSEPSDDIVINQVTGIPSAPDPGTITQPTCDLATGSVVLNGLPSTGTWTLTRSPGGFRINGSGTSVTDTGLAQGTYTYTVTNSLGCTSASSTGVVINSPPAVPNTPMQKVDCTLGSSRAVVTVMNTAPGMEYRMDDGSFQSSPEFTNVSNGTHTLTVRSSAGCTTTGSAFTVACGCVNGPSIHLSSRSGTGCGTSPVTVSNNSFGGNATLVTITGNGDGSVFPTNVTESPFSFTYTPAVSDEGRIVTITLTTNNPVGSPCSEATTTYSLTVGSVPSTPAIGNITHPTCTSSTGSVILNGLPSGSWNLLRTPGSVSIAGSGISTTVSGLSSGTYTFRVSNSAGCSSLPSAPVIINTQPPIAAAPVAGTIVQPTCTVATGNAELTGLPATGTWTLVRYPGTISTTGTGSTTTITALSSGTYNFTVTGQGGCTSPLSRNVVINSQPVTPLSPLAGTITPPTCITLQGKVVLTRLPGGPWTLNSVGGGITLTGTGPTATISNLAPGTYIFTVTNSAGCISPPTAGIIIPPLPEAPSLVIKNPDPVCAPATVDLTTPAITAGSAQGLSYTYWTNQAATNSYKTPSAATNGTYYIKATNSALCYDIKSVNVIVKERPVANAGPDQDLKFVFETTLTANVPVEGEKGIWSVFLGSGRFINSETARTLVTDLAFGRNVLFWTVTNNVCRPAADSVAIIVHDLIIPTLITPNEDGKNDYFFLEGISELKNSELLIFDRRGVMVYKNSSYKNEWNGMDYNGRQLPDDTYFFVLKTGNGRSRTGYVVIRR